MARPTTPKEVKPKAVDSVEDTAGAELPKSSPINLNMILMVVIIVLCTSLSSAASVYFLAPIVLKPLLAQHGGSQEEGGEEGEDGEESEEGGGEEGEEGGEESMPAIGPVLALDEFTVNLKDPGGQHYLRADLSLSLTTEDKDFEKLSGEALKKWEEEFHIEIAPYVPPIRDICISALTKRTVSELSTTQGKQEIKDEIKKQVDTLFHGKHKVIRVNFENFIIQ